MAPTMLRNEEDLRSWVFGHKKALGIKHIIKSQIAHPDLVVEMVDGRKLGIELETHLNCYRYHLMRGQRCDLILAIGGRPHKDGTYFGIPTKIVGKRHRVPIPVPPKRFPWREILLSLVITAYASIWFALLFSPVILFLLGCSQKTQLLGLVVWASYWQLSLLCLKVFDLKRSAKFFRF